MEPGRKVVTLDTAASAAFGGKNQKEHSLDDVFRQLDSDGDGELSRREVVAGAGKLHLTNEEAASLFDELDSDHSGTLERHEVHGTQNTRLDKILSMLDDEDSDSDDKEVREDVLAMLHESVVEQDSEDNANERAKEMKDAIKELDESIVFSKTGVRASITLPNQVWLLIFQ